MFKTLTGTTSLLGECPVWCERIERLFWTDMNDRFWPIPVLPEGLLWVFRGQSRRLLTTHSGHWRNLGVRVLSKRPETHFPNGE